MGAIRSKDKRKPHYTLKTLKINILLTNLGFWMEGEVVWVC